MNETRKRKQQQPTLAHSNCCLFTRVQVFQQHFSNHQNGHTSVHRHTVVLTVEKKIGLLLQRRKKIPQRFHVAQRTK